MTNPDDEMRAAVRQIFRDPDAVPEPPEPEPDRPRGPFAPREGANPSPRDDADAAMREFVGDLFGRDA